MNAPTASTPTDRYGLSDPARSIGRGLRLRGSATPTATTMMAEITRTAKKHQTSNGLLHRNSSSPYTSLKTTAVALSI